MNILTIVGTLLLRLLALIGVLWTGKHVVNQVASAVHKRQEGTESPPDQEISGEMVKDPVCQTYIPKTLAVQRMVDDVLYYFCSEDCAAKFSISKPS